MGVDVGLKLHVVIRQILPEPGLKSKALFIGELDSFAELGELAQRFNVVAGVIDAQPEARAAAEFVKSHGSIHTRLANYSRSELGFDTHREGGVTILRLNRNEVLDAMFESFKTGAAELPQDARLLGGRVRDGVGEYYRQMMAPKRLLEQNAQGNWTSRYDEKGKPDHFAHAETYCLQSMMSQRPMLAIITGGQTPMGGLPETF